MGRKSIAARHARQKDAAIAAKDAERKAAVAAAEHEAAMAAKDAEHEAAMAAKDAEREAAVADAIVDTTARLEEERKDDLRDAIRLLSQRKLYELAYKLAFMLSKSATELVFLVSQVERSHGRARANERRPPARPCFRISA